MAEFVSGDSPLAERLPEFVSGDPPPPVRLRLHLIVFMALLYHKSEVDSSRIIPVFVAFHHAFQPAKGSLRC